MRPTADHPPAQRYTRDGRLTSQPEPADGVTSPSLLHDPG